MPSRSKLKCAVVSSFLIAMFFMCSFAETVFTSGSLQRDETDIAVPEDNIFSVLVAAPEEVDKESKFTVVATGFRTDKNEIVDPTSITFTLRTPLGFSLEDKPGTKIYGSIYAATFTEVNVSTDLEVVVDAVWVSDFNVRYEATTSKTIHMDNWFNITSIVLAEQDRIETQVLDAMNATMTGMENITAEMKQFAVDVADALSNVADMFDGGLLDGSDLEFFVFHDEWYDNVSINSNGTSNEAAFNATLPYLDYKGLNYSVTYLHDNQSLYDWLVNASNYSYVRPFLINCHEGGIWPMNSTYNWTQWLNLTANAFVATQVNYFSFNSSPFSNLTYWNATGNLLNGDGLYYMNNRCWWYTYPSDYEMLYINTEPKKFATLTDGGAATWIQGFWGTALTNYQEVNETWLFDTNYADTSVFDVPEFDHSACAAIISPVSSLYHISVPNRTQGLLGAIGMFYQNMKEVVDSQTTALTRAEERMLPLNASLSQNITYLIANITQHWLELNLSALDADFVEAYSINIAIMNASIPELENRSAYMHDEVSAHGENATILDQNLETAGSDISFGIFGFLPGILPGLPGGGGGGGWLPDLPGIFPPIFPPFIPPVPEFVEDAAEDLVDFSKEWLDDIWDGIKDLVGGAIELTILKPTQFAFGMMEKGLTGAIELTMTMVKMSLNGILQLGKILLEFIAGDLMQAIEDLRKEVKDAIERVVVVIQDVINWVADGLIKVAELIVNVTELIVNFASQLITTFVNEMDNLANTLQSTREDMYKSTGFFFQTRDTLFASIQESEVMAFLLRYASESYGLTDEIFLKQYDVLNPISVAQQAEFDTHIISLPNATSGSYYIIVLQGGLLTDMDNYSINAQTVSETYQLTPTKRAVGVYEVPMGDLPRWNYLVVGNATVNNVTVWLAEKISTVDVPDPIKFGDAVIDIDFYAPERIGSGKSAAVTIDIENERYTEPDVTVRLTLTHSTYGTRKVYIQQVSLEAEGTQSITFNIKAEWWILTGKYDLIVEVIEPNGDITTFEADTQIEITLSTESATIWALIAIGPIGVITAAAWLVGRTVLRTIRGIRNRVSKSDLMALENTTKKD